MTKNDIGTIILNWLKGFFTKNLALKIVSLLFAMLIWGYVMVEVNPKRVKTITDVPISFSGESSLHDRGLAVRGDRDDILRNVTGKGAAYGLYWPRRIGYIRICKPASGQQGGYV